MRERNYEYTQIYAVVIESMQCAVRFSREVNPSNKIVITKWKYLHAGLTLLLSVLYVCQNFFQPQVYLDNHIICLKTVIYLFILSIYWG